MMTPVSTMLLEIFTLVILIFRTFVPQRQGGEGGNRGALWGNIHLPRDKKKTWCNTLNTVAKRPYCKGVPLVLLSVYSVYWDGIVKCISRIFITD